MVLDRCSISCVYTFKLPANVCMFVCSYFQTVMTYTGRNRSPIRKGCCIQQGKHHSSQWSSQWVLLGEDLVISPTCWQSYCEEKAQFEHNEGHTTFHISNIVKWGASGLILWKTNCEGLWNGHGIPDHGFPAQLLCPRAKLTTWYYVICMQLGQLDSFV